MIVLSAATYTLELVLSAGTADVDISYVDRTATTYPIGGTQQTAATATTQTICSAPAASTSREIDFLSVKIKTTGGVVTVQKLNSSGSVTTQLISVTLLDEECLVYTHGSGWTAIDANGNRKEVTSTLLPSLNVTGNAAIGGTLGVTGAVTMTAGLVLPGTAANISIGSNFISNGGTDAGLSIDGANDAAFSGLLSVGGASIKIGAGTTGNGTLQIGPDTPSVDQGGSITLINSNAVKNWKISHNDLFAGLSITPSTASGGSTFTTPVLTITTAGAVAIPGSLAVGTTVKTGGYTVGTLPAGTVGMRAYVTDATAPTYNGALTGGGAVTVPVFYNGAAWVSA